MTSAFVFQGAPHRIVFGCGTLAEVGAELEKAGGKRALLLSTPFQKPDIEALADQLGDRAAEVFADAAMHTPVEVTEQAVAAFKASAADCVVAYGGGSTIGLGKAIAYRNDCPQIVVATTYAGSEVTPILGQTENGIKTTVRNDKILPEVVIYDPELTVGLPVGMSVTSGLNAMAHAVEGLYAQDRNPISSLMALEGIKALKSALPAIVQDPADIEARSNALYGSWLCGSVLGAVGMALHHKLCHTLGGSFDLPHAETHSILLPHTAAYNSPAASAELAEATALFGGDLGKGLYDFAVSLGAPLKLSEIGMPKDGIDKAADIAVKNPYWNPRDLTREGICDLLARAYAGHTPQ